MNQPVLTVTLNPALDMTGNLSELKTGKVNLVHSGSLHPAGKGVNVARVLSDLGSTVCATGFLGYENDAGFVDLFHQTGVVDHFVRVPGACRINVKLVEDSGEVTDLNFPGVAIAPKQKQALESKLLKLAASHELIVIAGSLPTGITPDNLAHWVRLLGKQGKKVIIDTSKEAFKTVLSATPWLVKPNTDELAEWVGHGLETEEQLMQAGEMIAAMGVSHVVISRGAEGVLWLHKDKWLKARPPRMQVVSTVGAGDTLVAGFCHGLKQNGSREHVIAFATALSALAVSQVGVGVASPDPVHQLVKQIVVSEITL